jgi:predicted small metal-binding protein
MCKSKPVSYEKEGNMTKILKCKDIGVDCDFVASGKTVEEVLKKAAEHARKDHGIKRVTKDYKDSWRKLIRNG